MRADGDVLLKSELIDPSSTNLHQLVRRVRLMTISSRKAVWQEDILVFKLLIEVRENARPKCLCLVAYMNSYLFLC